MELTKRSCAGRALAGVLIALGAAVVLGAVGVAVVVHRAARAIDPDGKVRSSVARAAGRVAASLPEMSREEHRPKSYGCSLLSQQDAGSIAGTAITRVESASDSCSYFGVPDKSLNPEAEAIRSLPGLPVDPQASKMIDGFTKGMRAEVEAKDPGARAGPGGERLLFGINDSAALSASMEAARGIAGTPLGGEAVADIGDDAVFSAMHRMFFVRKGTRYLLIQPQFVRDPRGVAIAAARKVLASPNF